ncbi:MAG: phosphate ABC transporter substrate-binding protein [Lachnospiraceae bacterium]|nr:phosphate ABC transporter substrate-binding protein [Lachnospiraceae bacterium]
MRKSVKFVSSLCALTLAMSALAGCSSSSSTMTTAAETTAAETTAEQTTAAATEADTSEAAAESEAGEAAEISTDITGTISMAGSTSMEKLANAVAEAFPETYTGVTVTAEFTGSSAGIESLLAGSVDIGNSSRNLKDEEIEAGAVENIVAIDGIAVVVDTANTVEDLTQEQLIQIYTGEVSNWSEVGGEDQAIVVVGRESGSGTRGAFEEILGIEDACAYANELDSTGAVMAKVASTPGAIGYASLDVLDDTVKAVTLEGVEATEENIKDGSYFLQRPFVMATLGEISEQSEAVQALFAWLQSDAGKEVITSVGLITVD